MAQTIGRSEIRVGLIDGPIALAHAELAEARLIPLGDVPAGCDGASSSACRHGTFVAGMLCARRGGAAPAICPGCTFLICPIFRGSASASSKVLAERIIMAVDAGAKLINLSIGSQSISSSGDQILWQALDHAALTGAVIVAAVGNQGVIGSSAITRHPAVISVLGTDLRGRPLQRTNLGATSARRGVAAPGTGVTSISPDGGTVTLSGTSVAAPIVTGALALLWSKFPGISAVMLRDALVPRGRGRVIMPPMLDVRTAYAQLAALYTGGYPRWPTNLASRKRQIPRWWLPS
ncbi:S8 family serine peptidase [Streptomyces sp. NPDC007162]|uniref:S8 family serine peptidase n=1 Tax=Streptomyces sp. NPDC007162 TaxID=3156917 RepID=UPI0033F616E3